MDITFSSNLPEVIEAFEKAPEIMDRNLEQKMSRGAKEVTREARNIAPKAFSNLTNSIIDSRVGPLHYRISPGVNYAPHVEDGSRPHFPNPANLLPWVKLKLRLQGHEAENAAFLISKAIGKRGTPKQPFMEPTFQKMKSRVFELMDQGVAAGIKEAFQ